MSAWVCDLSELDQVGVVGDPVSSQDHVELIAVDVQLYELESFLEPHLCRADGVVAALPIGRRERPMPLVIAAENAPTRATPPANSVADSAVRAAHIHAA